MGSLAFPAPSTVEAKPPASEGFLRADALQSLLSARLAELKAKEEFDAKPRPEKLTVLLSRGTKKLGRESITGAVVIEVVIGWEALHKAELPEAAVRTVKLLPEALRNHYGDFRSKSRTQRRDRQRASKALVAALGGKHSHVRSVAIECLFALYGERRGYRADAPEAQRKRAQKAWIKALRR